jgi:hypothetical protein
MFANGGNEEVVKIGSISFTNITGMFLYAGYYGLLPDGSACRCFFFLGSFVDGA